MPAEYLISQNITNYMVDIGKQETANGNDVYAAIENQATTVQTEVNYWTGR